MFIVHRRGNQMPGVMVSLIEEECNCVECSFVGKWLPLPKGNA